MSEKCKLRKDYTKQSDIHKNATKYAFNLSINMRYIAYPMQVRTSKVKLKHFEHF